MGKILLQLRTVVAMLFIALASVASAEEFTYNFLSAIPQGWTASTAPNGFESSNLSRGSQFTANSKLTLKDAKNVTKVVLVCSSNIDGKNTIAVTVGGKSMGETVTLAKENNVEKSFAGSAASGDVVIAITRADKSVYINKVIITADEISGATPGGDDGDDEGEDDDTKDDDLVADYEYAEPTTIVPSGTIGNNTSYSFVKNNIKVSASLGAQAEGYFGCNAGHSITFTATQPIKALVINGYVKAGFDATASAGDIYFYSDEAEVVEDEQVLVVLDIDAKSVTINCVKQLRCYSVDFYFEENPDVEVGDDEGDDDELYGYDWEPEDISNFNFTFSDVEVGDYSEELGYDYVDLYFSNEEADLELAILAPSVAKTILTPGTYTIRDSLEPGTVLASPGGDDYYDYPSCITTNFEEIDGEIWYDPYYIVSGTLTVTAEGEGVKMVLDAKTYNGSTVKMTYQGTFDAINSVKAEKKADLSKQLINGRLYIVKDGKQYSADGRRIK